MGIKKGTKLTEKPKSILYQVRVDEETDRKAKEVCKVEGISKSEVVRQGIDLKYNQLGKVVEFQIPVSDCVRKDDADMAIRGNTKIHIFVNGNSLCGKHRVIPEYFKTTEFGEESLLSHPEYFCKVCRKKYLNGLESKNG